MNGYTELTTSRGYPNNQRVLLLDDLPKQYTEQEIIDFFIGERNYFSMEKPYIFKSLTFFFAGMDIERIVKYSGTRKAFVVFESVDDIESALLLCTVTFKRVQIKMYRSSLQQLNRYLGSVRSDDSPKSPSTPLMSSSVTSNPSPSAKPTGARRRRQNRVIIRDLPWNTTPIEVLEFLDGINTAHGEKSISVSRGISGPMTALVHLASAEDHDCMISRKWPLFNSREIYGKYLFGFGSISWI